MAVGLYLVLGRLIVARREAARTFYAITDRRLLMESGAFRRTFTELDLCDLPLSTLEEGSNGLGTITIGSASWFMRVPPGWPFPGMYGQALAIVSVPTARAVYDMLQRAKAEAREA